MQKIIKIAVISIYLAALFPKFVFDTSLRGIVFFTLLVAWSVCAVKTLILSDDYKLKIKNLVILFLLLFFKLINQFYIFSYNISDIIFFLGIYFVFDMFSNKKENIEFFWLTTLIILFLPIQEYIQIFIGTPMRFFSAEIISKILNLFHFSYISQISVLNFENSVMNIDYSCSGSVTFWVLLVFVSIICLIKKIQFSNNVILVSLCSILLLFFFNTTRIVVLIMLNCFKIKENLLSNIHTLLGLINFSLLFVFIYYLLYKTINKNNQINYKYTNNKYITALFIITGLLFIPLNYKSFKHSDFESEINLSEGTRISEYETNFYKEHRAIVLKSKKDGIIKLIVKTDNWRSHHNPVNCIKGYGHKILTNKTLMHDDKYIREIQTDKGYIYFFFKNDEIITDDYYKRVFYSFFQKDKNWILIEYSSPNKMKIKDIFDKNYLLSELPSSK